MLVEIQGFTFCDIVLNAPWILSTYLQIVPRFVLSSLLFILAVIQPIKQSVEMYMATKRWQPNQYIQLLAKDGILYFFVYVFLFPAHLFLFITIMFRYPSHT